jgi:hypothetical protein
VRDQLRERLRDPFEELLEILLGEDVVEDVREPAVGLNRIGRSAGVTGQQSQWCCRRGRNGMLAQMLPQGFAFPRSRP